MAEGFLPVSRQDMQAQGIEQLDFVYICGDAYVDHPSFGSAIISRVLQSRGYTVGMICQPDWRNPESAAVLGEPRLGFLVSSGNMDSMVNHYTVGKKHRSRDAFSPGGVMGKRPDNAVVVYGNLIRRTFKKTPLILGGLEASLRRMSHYDYWSDRVRRSILLEAGADLISYGMGERSIVEIADALASGMDVRDITYIDGTVYKTKNEEDIFDAVRLPDHELVRVPDEKGKRAYAQSFALQHANTDPFQAKRLYETYGGKTFVVQNPPAKRSPSPRGRWMMSMRFPICAPGIPCTMPKAVCLLLERSGSALHPTGAATVTAISVLLPSTRAASYRCAATSPSCRRQGRCCRSQISRAIFMMSEVRPRSSAHRPVKSR